ncbi:MAG: SMI1/KNR4 family protein [Candidatus Lokiarchaeota archaeon]|nr:SMI1/KNR4 family protein [Candidatus Lokiarchaeota archaeon]
MTSSIEKLFQDYKKWYQTEYVPKIIKVLGYEDKEEFDEDFGLDPLADLEPLNDDELQEIENQFGVLPEIYKTFLKKIGVGLVWLAYDVEPIDQEFIHPDEYIENRDGAFSWLNSENEKIVKEKGFDPDKAIPIYTNDGMNGWAFMLTQDAKDDRVFIFHHDYESGHPLPDPMSFIEFITTLFKEARDLSPKLV